MNSTTIGKTSLLDVGLFLVHIFLIGDRHLEFGRLRINWATSTGNAKQLSSSLPEKNTKKLRTFCAKIIPNLAATEDDLVSRWCEGCQHMECTKISANVYNALSSFIHNIVFFVLPVYNYSLLH